MLKKLITAAVLLLLAWLMIRETAAFYLLNGSYFWFVFFTLGLYLLPFITPLYHVALPLLKRDNRKWVALILLVVSLLSGVAILKYNLPYTYTDEGGVGKAAVNQVSRWLGIGSAGVLTVIDAIYLSHDWRLSLRPEAIRQGVKIIVTNIGSKHSITQRRENPKLVKRYLIWLNCCLPYILLISGEIILYLVPSSVTWALQILWVYVTGILCLCVQGISYLRVRSYLQGLKIKRQLAIIFSTIIILFIAAWLFWLLAIKSIAATGFLAACLWFLTLVVGPYIVLPLLSGLAVRRLKKSARNH